MTMFAGAVRNGERFSLSAWVGLVVAFGGLVYLVAPGVTAPDSCGAALMVLAGVGWGTYSLIGRGAAQFRSLTIASLNAFENLYTQASEVADAVALKVIGEMVAAFLTSLHWQGYLGARLFVEVYSVPCAICLCPSLLAGSDSEWCNDHSRRAAST